MTNYNGNPSGPLNTGVPLVDTTDLVIGGASGNANAATKLLMDNDAYLYGLLGKFEGVVTLNVSAGATANITVANLTNNLLLMNVNAATNFTGNLPDVGTYPVGGIAVVKRQGAYSNPVTLQAHAGQTFSDRNGNTPSSIFLHNGESVTLCNVSSKWQILEVDGNYYDVGDQMFGYNIKPGTLKRDGTLYGRAGYPRLWAWILANGLAVSDATWSSNPGGSLCPYPYKSMFSTGDGSTTFRVPDDRGLFDRALDIGAGIDADRVSALLEDTVASKEADSFSSHTHIIDQTPHTHGTSETPHTHQVGTYNTTGGAESGLAGIVDSNSCTPDPFASGGAVTGLGINNASIIISNENTGGTENRPINVGKLPLLVY